MRTPDILLLNGMVDMHVHCREPDTRDEPPENFATASQAAIAGGFTNIFDMPNNYGRRTNSPERLDEKARLALGNVACNIGFYYGYQPEDDNIGTFAEAATKAFGLKSMLEISTGSDRQTEASAFRSGWEEWSWQAEPTQPIILHAENDAVAEGLAISAGEIGHPTHVAHVSNRTELQHVIDAKKQGWPVTCGVTPHHLFLRDTDVLNWYQRMKPPLASPENQEFLWRNLYAIDVIETDHAPHSRVDKDRANVQNPRALEVSEAVKAYGVPGLDSALPLLLDAALHGAPYGAEFTRERIANMTSTNPRRILGLPPTSTAHVLVTDERYEFSEADVRSKCGWSPFIGRLVTGRVMAVDRYGTRLYDGVNGTYARPAVGRVLLPEKQRTV